MEYINLVQRFQAFNNLNKDPPHFLLLEVGLLFLVFRYLLEEVAVVRVLHHNTTQQIVSQSEAATYHRELDASSIKAS